MWPLSRSMYLYKGQSSPKFFVLFPFDYRFSFDKSIPGSISLRIRGNLPKPIYEGGGLAAYAGLGMGLSSKALA